MDWAHIVFWGIPYVLFCILIYMMCRRIINIETDILTLLRIIESLRDRIDLTEANQKIFYELHKRNS